MFGWIETQARVTALQEKVCQTKRSLTEQRARGDAAKQAEKTLKLEADHREAEQRETMRKMVPRFREPVGRKLSFLWLQKAVFTAWLLSSSATFFLCWQKIGLLPLKGGMVLAF